MNSHLIIRYVFCYLLLIIISGLNFYSPWIQIHGPNTSIKVPGIFNHENRIYLGTNCRLHSMPIEANRWNLYDFTVCPIFSQKGDRFIYGGRGIFLHDLSNPEKEPISFGDSCDVREIEYTIPIGCTFKLYHGNSMETKINMVYWGSIT